MKRIYIKLVVIALIIFCILTVNSHVFGFAFDPEDYRPNAVSISDAEETINIAGRAIGAIKNVGVIIAVIAITIIGIGYIFSSVDEKAKYKEALFPWVIGIVFITCSGLLVDTFYSVMTGEGTNQETPQSGRIEAAHNVHGVRDLYEYIREYYTSVINSTQTALTSLSNEQIIEIYEDFVRAYNAMDKSSGSEYYVFTNLSLYNAMKRNETLLGRYMAPYYTIEQDAIKVMIKKVCERYKTVKKELLETVPHLQKFITDGFYSTDLYISDSVWLKIREDYESREDYYIVHYRQYREALNALKTHFGNDLDIPVPEPYIPDIPELD